MRSALKIGVTTLVVGYFVGCAPVKFDAAPPAPCSSNGVDCVVNPQSGNRDYTVERTVGDAMADILFIDDNSGSMSTEQQSMANRFPTFISNLDSLNINYRIGMITTDVANTSPSPSGPNVPSAANGYGAYQSGTLLQFSGAQNPNYLTKSDSNRSSIFINTVVRQETINCENSNFQNCPSDDERGVFAANLLVSKEASANTFFRPTAHLAIVILSDEDERGISDPAGADTRSSSTYNNDLALINIHPLDARDKAQTLIDNLHSRFPGKTLSVHPIVVKSGDYACKDAQAAQHANVRGDFGIQYEALMAKAGGTEGSICDSDYGATLTNIASSIADQVTSLPFSCRPINDNYDVTFSPQPTQNIRVTADFSKLVLNINDPLPPGTHVTLKYTCANQ